MANPVSLWRSFLARPNDDRGKIFGVAILLAFLCSLAISAATVTLRPVQLANLEAERAARMAGMLDALPGMEALLEEAGVDGLEVQMVDLASGTFVPDADASTFDYEAANSDPETSVAVPSGVDIAGLKTRPAQIPVYLLQRDGDLLLLVLPVRGRGYQSTITAMVALEADLNTVAALTILSQDETPGLGARIEEDEWQAQWPGKQIANEDGTLRINVVKGGSSTPYEVDGVSGATMTSNGVADMIRYWLGSDGFGPLLQNLKSGGM